MKEEEIAQLIQDESFINYCFRKNKEDVQYWEDWLTEHPEHSVDIAALKKHLLLMTTAAGEKMKQQHFFELQAKIADSARKGRNYLWWRAGAAASIIVLLSVGGYFLLHKQQQPQLAIRKEPARDDIQPGGNKAILTLNGGQQVVLSDASNGTVAHQGSTVVNKTADGQLLYNDSTSAQNGTAGEMMNTITTPRGGQWFVTLSDGTRVWLNAASSITYPVAFTRNERNVSITGEAYFEVVHNAAKPFSVKAGNMLVEDIGTAFNINAYADEPAFKTTLVNGSARVSESKDAHILMPGQQAIVKMNGNAIQVKKVKVEDVIGWKNGQILFENEDLETIMRQASRWYDVNVIYQGTIPNRLFIGGIPRKSKLSEFLKILEYENVHYTLSGNTIIVKP